MESLPNEILEKIFEDIDETEKKPVREVCTKWYGMNPIETMTIKYKNDDQERIINDILKIKPKELVFSYCHDIPGRFSIKEILDAVINQTDVYMLKIEHCYLHDRNEEYDFCFDKLTCFMIIESSLCFVNIQSESLGALKIVDSGLQEINLECPMLYTIDLNGNNLTKFSHYNNNLMYLNLSYNHLRELSLDCFDLHHLDLEYNEYMEMFDVEAPTLEFLNLTQCKQICDEIEFNEYLNLETLHVSDTCISELDISELTNLQELNISFTHNLGEIDLSHNINLVKLQMFRSSLETIDLSNNNKLNDIEARENPQLIIDTSHLKLVSYNK
jgi:hypothetical protein